MLYSTIEAVKHILDIANDDLSRDDVLRLIIDKNELWVRGTCNIESEAPLCEELSSLTQDLSVVSFNRLGSEGLKNESVGPVTMNYENLSDRHLGVINRYKRVKF